MRESQAPRPEPFFLAADGIRLSACVHPPAARSRRPAVALVVCPPLADEHIASQRVLYRLADRLASRDVPVLRLDPPGHGDSDAELADATPERFGAASDAAARWLRARTGARRVGFLGVRLGCAAALRSASGHRDTFCVLWAPVHEPDRYFRDWLRRQVLSDVMYGGERRSVAVLLEQLAAGKPVDVGGYLLTQSFHAAYCAVDLLAQIEAASCPLQVVQRETPEAGAPRTATLRAAQAADDELTCDEEIFWNFPRKGTVPPMPERWLGASADWIAAQAAGDGVMVENG